MESRYITTTGRLVILIPITLIRPHETHDPVHTDALRARMFTSGEFTHPVCLDRKTMTLLDGHHRFRASQSLEFVYVPAVLIDYQSEDVTVTAWRPGELVTREDVLAAAASGKLLPIKTSRHVLGKPIGECNVSLGRLRAKARLGKSSATHVRSWSRDTAIPTERARYH